MSYSTLDNPLEAMADEIIGNWQRFDSFAWFDRPADCENWTIYYTHHRDSDTLTRSNAHVICEALDALESEDVRGESHSHWAVGWVEGYAIRVRNESGEITEAFKVLADLLMQMEDYPVLDEDHWSELECDEAIAAWDDWARRDYVYALRKELEARGYERVAEAVDDMSAEAVDDMVEHARQSVNWEYEFESSGPYFNIEGLVELTRDCDIRAALRK